MKKVILLIVMFLIPIELMAGEITGKESKEELAVAIRSNDYVCDSCNFANFLGKKHKGLVFRAVCNDNSLVYRVTLTPSKRFLVEPW